MIITSERAKKAILTALADEEMRKILDCVMDVSMSVNDIMREKKIPYTTAYRKTKWLLDEGLLAVSKINITPEGKKSSLVHTVLKSVTIKYEKEAVSIEAEQNYDVVKKMMTKFFSLE
jgi:DNA-binding transcriptional ArsR family regulator